MSQKGALLLSELAKNDKLVFTVKDAKKVLKEEPYLTLHFLKKNNWILGLKGGLYAIVPLEIGNKGAEDFIIHEFVMASYLTKPYYIAFWSALNYHGLSEQIPNSVFIAAKIAKKSLIILNSEFLFVKLQKNKFFGFEKINIENRKINISNINKTIADCLDHPEHSGGTEETAKSILFNHKELNFETIKNYALEMKNITILKRLGYILEKVGLLEEYKEIFKDVKLTKGYSKLDTISRRKGRYNDKWRLLVNIEVNPDRWMY